MLPLDLMIALLVILVISLLLAWTGIKSKRPWSNWLALLAETLWLNNNLFMARVLPIADVGAWGNLQTPAMGLLAGVAWSRLPGPRWQKWLFVGALVGIGIWRLAEPYTGAQPAIGSPHWSHGICIQSTKSTCSDAAAATLLAHAGINASEAEMARLCLTSDDGTTILGLYRGMKLKTADTAWKVVVLSGSAADLKHEPLPAIVTVGDPAVPGGLHSVVVFSYHDDKHIEIGDPFTGGMQQWNLAALSRDYVGQGIALVKR